MLILRATGVAALLLLAGIGWHLAPLYPGVVTLQLTWTPQAFGWIVHSWSPESLLRYRTALPAGGLLLACYGAFGHLLVTRTSLFAGCAPALRAALAWTLPVAAAVGGARIALHWWLTEVPRFGVPWAYATSAACVAAEWLLVTGFVLAAIHAQASRN